MKIIIPNHSAPDSFVDNVSFTLIKMGHEVTSMPLISNKRINSPLKRYSSLIHKKLSPGSLTLQEKWLIEKTKSNKFDCLLCLTQSINEEVLEQVKKYGLKYTLVWWCDTPANMKGMGILNDKWDFIFLKDKAAVSKLKGIGLNAELLHEAMNPAWHKPLTKQVNNNLVVAGTFYGYRQYLVSKLIEKNVDLELYGGRLPLWVKPEIKRIHTKRFIVKEEKSRIFGSALACLNSTDMSEGNSLNCRAFEIAGAGGLQFMEYKEIIPDCFEPGKEILTFNFVEEILELREKYSRDKEEAEKIREAGYKRAVSEHTYEHRLKHILSKLK